MFNIKEIVQLQLAAEKINASRNLTDAEKLAMLTALQGSILITAPGCPEALKIVHASIGRMTANERANLAARTEQGRATERVEKPAEVAAGRAEESTEAPEGPTEGVEEQAEDAGRADRSQSDAPKPATGKRKAKAKA